MEVARLEHLVAAFAATVPAGAMILDAGAGDAPYRSLFQHARYEAADVCKRAAHRYEHVDYQCDLAAIPVESSRYDAVLCTQVLEHVPHPREVLTELARVLKPRGRLWLSAPLAFEEHEIPYDFFRYTQFGLRELVQGVGLDVEHLGWVGGYFATLAHQSNIARHALPRRPGDYGGGAMGMLAAGASYGLRLIWGLLALYYSRLEMRHRYTGGGHCLDYYVVARKAQ